MALAVPLAVLARVAADKPVLEHDREVRTGHAGDAVGDEHRRVRRPEHRGPWRAGNALAAGPTRAVEPGERVDPHVAGVSTERTKTAAGRIAENLVALTDPRGRGERSPPAAVRVDDEVHAAEPLGDLLPVVQLAGGPVEVGGVDEEPLGLLDAGLGQPPRRRLRSDRVGSTGVDVHGDVGQLLEPPDGVAELIDEAVVALPAVEAPRGDQRVDLQVHHDLEVADAIGEPIDPVLVATREAGVRGVAAAAVDERIGGQLHHRAGLAMLGPLEVLRHETPGVGLVPVPDPP